jgi:hypothetical protein
MLNKDAKNINWGKDSPSLTDDARKTKYPHVENCN